MKNKLKKIYIVGLVTWLIVPWICVFMFIKEVQGLIDVKDKTIKMLNYKIELLEQHSDNAEKLINGIKIPGIND